MKKSTYSLILSDDVVKAIDREAVYQGTSRSNLINQILAERMSCVTPEMRMNGIFGYLSDYTQGKFQVERHRSAPLMILRTAIDYKYRPTLYYKVELDRTASGFLGTLRVTMRTTNVQLLELFESFLIGWIEAEKNYLSRRGCRLDLYQITPGNFQRKLLNTGLDEEETASAISLYLDEMNKMMQAYFADPMDIGELLPLIGARYGAMIRKFIV